MHQFQTYTNSPYLPVDDRLGHSYGLLNELAIPELSVRGARQLALNLLENVGIESCVIDSDLLVAHALSVSRLDLCLLPDRPLTKAEQSQFFASLSRRLCFEPMAYIFGKKEFFGHEFGVDQNCLIPRPDTECVVEKVLQLAGDKPMRIFELCTGSGAIAISLAKTLPNVDITASDISLGALTIAQKNAHHLGVKSRVSFLHGDLFAPFSDLLPADIVVANPPYIATDIIRELAPDVRFEPMLALDGGENGLAFYRRIIREADRFLCDSGWLVLEIGFDQGDQVASIFGEPWVNMEILRDWAGHHRVVVAQKKAQV